MLIPRSASDNEQVCQTSLTWTMSSPYGRGNAKAAGSVSKGGFAKYWRGPAHFAIPVPKELDPASTAPMYCGGITANSPLEHY